jgi:hypothetical protein
MGRWPERYGIVVDEQVRRRYHGGICFDMPYRDPHGMKEDEKEKIVELYRKHGERHLYTAPRRKGLLRLLDASTLGRVGDVRFRFAGSDEFAAAERWFSRSGRRYRRHAGRIVVPSYQTQSDLAYVIEARSAMEVPEIFWRLFTRVAGQTLSAAEVARTLNAAEDLPQIPADVVLWFLRMAVSTQLIIEASEPIAGVAEERWRGCT